MTSSSSADHRIIPVQPYSELSLPWQGQLVSVRYTPVWYRMEGQSTVAHLEIKSADRSALPFSKTGYKSTFIIEPPADFDPVSYVLEWLQSAARDPNWKAAQDAGRQGSLF